MNLKLFPSFIECNFAMRTDRSQKRIMELKQRIIHKTAELFMRYGIKSITMDDISRELGISKKTLYQYVDNKTDLIEQIFQAKIEQEKTLMAQIRDEAVDAVDEILKIAKYVIEEIHQLSPTTMYDLQKYYRSTWKAMEALHQQHIYTIIRENIIWGMEDGYYREEMNPDIIAKLYVGNSSIVCDEEIFPIRDYQMEVLFKEYISYHMHGIASPKGLALMEQYLAKEKETID